ncbi:hypothetical protein [Tsukamurella sp. NPDC003166]|uniref:hypothetical protein n=1 Tax=Tsukamurella sp. NPDC003166 TaxID=3154444 RepID=UPI0033AF02E2
MAVPLKSSTAEVTALRARTVSVADFPTVTAIACVAASCVVLIASLTTLVSPYAGMPRFPLGMA